MADIRKGMWLRYGAHVGVAAAISDGDVELHRVNAAGETISIATVERAAVTKAAYLDIPESRRPPAAVAKSLGYL